MGTSKQVQETIELKYESIWYKFPLKCMHSFFFYNTHVSMSFLKTSQIITKLRDNQYKL